MNRFAYIALHVVLYSAIMLAVTWALWQVTPGVADWLMGGLGPYQTLAVIVGFVALCYGLSYLAGRSDSGSARDP